MVINKATAVIDSANHETTLGNLLEAYPDLVMYDQSGHEIALGEDIESQDECLRILIWSSESDSENDTGANAIGEILIPRDNDDKTWEKIIVATL